ncbi:MAG: rhomboid family intramembrane serine protease, partial [Ekhidna sp.]
IQDFQVEGTTPKRSFVIATEAAKKLNWDIGFLSESGFIAYTKFSWSSWSEEVQFKIDFHNINIKSECTGSQVVDWGKNRKNIERFISTYNSIKDEYSLDELDSKFNELEQSFVSKDEDIIGQPHLAKKQQINGFLSIFQAREGYFVTPCLLGLNLLVFIFMIALGVNILLPNVESLIEWGANYKPLTLDNQWWRLISSCFIHIGILHFLVNMYALIYIGLILEPYLGKARFFSAYILSGIAGSVASLHWNELTVSAGASGAIFGMYGVFLALLTTNLIEKSARKAILTSIIVFVGYNLLNGLQHQGIDNAAHIGGLTSGLIFGYAFYPSLIKPKRKVLKTATILLLIALVSYPSYIVLATTSNDIMTYEKRMEQFASLEEKALSIYNNQQVSNDELLIEIRDNGIPNWEKSISLLKGTDSLDIPQHLQDR